MASSQRYGAHSGRGGTIAVALIATAGGVAALFAYHTSPGHTDGMATETANAVPAAGTTAVGMGDTNRLAAAPRQSTKKGKATSGTSGKTGKTGKGGGTTTFTGDPADTRWGVVQVKISVKNGKITSAEAVQHPHSTQHSIEINQRAIPILNTEAVKAGSAMVDSVSGATVTSGGYQQSLQSAVDMAHI